MFVSLRCSSVRAQPKAHRMDKASANQNRPEAVRACTHKLCARPRNPSFWLNASRSNDFAPLRALLGDEGSKLGRRIPLRHDAKGLETLGGFRPFEIRGQRGVERVDDRSRRAGAGEEALPAADVI